MSRERRDFKRPSFTRHVQNLFIIATEGQKTEVKYFEEFKDEKYHSNQKVYIEVLKRLTSGSSPTSIIRQLDGFKSEYKLRDGDELWMVIDRDKQSWSVGEIANVARLCSQKSYGFALSNPSFELWLLLHKTDLNIYSAQELQTLFANTKTGSRSALEIELLRICGSYNKSNLNVEDFLPFVQQAILRARTLVIDENERWPSDLGTNVYKLVEKLLP